MSLRHSPHGARVGASPQRAKNSVGTLRRLWAFIAPQKRKLFAAVAMVMASSALALAGPYVVGRAVDSYIVERKTDGFFATLILLLAIYLALGAATFWQNYWMIDVGQRTVRSIRERLFHHFHELPISFFDRRQQGELMSRITNDIDNMSQTFNSTVVQVVSSTLTLMGAMVVMLSQSVVLTIVTLVVVPLMYVGMRWITNRTRVRFREQQRALGEMNGFIEEVISGQKVVKLFSQEERMEEELARKNAELKQAGFWAQTYSGFIPKLMNFLNNLSFGLIAVVGGWLAAKGTISVGTIVVFVEYARQLPDRLMTWPINGTHCCRRWPALNGCWKFWICRRKRKTSGKRWSWTGLMDALSFVKSSFLTTNSVRRFVMSRFPSHPGRRSRLSVQLEPAKRPYCSC